MKYLLIEHKTFKTIKLAAGDCIEFTYFYEDRKSAKVTNYTNKKMSVSEVLVIITEDNGVVKSMVLMDKEYEPR